MCEEESDDSEAVAKLLEINDSIHRTIERYTLVRKGDLDAASKIPQGTLGTSTGVSKTKDNELSLIDLDGDPIPTSAHASGQGATGQPKQGFLEDDLLGLSMQDHTYGQGGGIALGFGANTSKRSFPPLSLGSSAYSHMNQISQDRPYYHHSRKRAPLNLLRLKMLRRHRQAW